MSSDYYRREVSVGDAVLTFELDLATTWQLTTSSKLTDPDCNPDFVWGWGNVYFSKLNREPTYLFGGEDIGNFVMLLDKFEKLLVSAKLGATEVGRICGPGQVGPTLERYHVSYRDEDKKILPKESYDLLVACQIGGSQHHGLYCYAAHGICYLEVMAEEAERWFHQVDPDDVLREITLVQQELVAALESYSAERSG